MLAWHKNVAANSMAGWQTHMHGLEQSIVDLEADIADSRALQRECSGEWCVANERVLDELSNALFSIHEPTFTAPAQSAKIKELKRRVYDLYGLYRSPVH